MLHPLRSDSASATASDPEHSVGPSGPRGEGAVGPGASDCLYLLVSALTTQEQPNGAMIHSFNVMLLFTKQLQVPEKDCRTYVKQL